MPENFDTDQKLEAALYVVPTPVGNLEDITLRAINVLREADIIACEDTRRTGMLLKHFNITPKKLESYHNHNEQTKAEFLSDKILGGASVALVSDAGTPAISDPGYRIVNAAIEKEIKIIALPGATALIPALAASGLAVNEFSFMGFPPQKKGRKTFIEMAMQQPRTTILYESPFRILKLLKEIDNHSSKRKVCLAREISKIYEEYIRGTAAECIELLSRRQNIKGEFVVVIERLSE